MLDRETLLQTGYNNPIEVLKTVPQVQGLGYGALKEAVAEAVVAEFAPIQARYNEIIADKEGLNAMLKANAERAQALAQRTLRKVYKKVGLYQL